MSIFRSTISSYLPHDLIMILLKFWSVLDRVPTHVYTYLKKKKNLVLFLFFICQVILYSTDPLISLASDSTQFLTHCARLNNVNGTVFLIVVTNSLVVFKLALLSNYVLILSWYSKPETYHQIAPTAFENSMICAQFSHKITSQ